MDLKYSLLKVTSPMYVLKLIAHIYNCVTLMTLGKHMEGEQMKIYESEIEGRPA